MNEMAATVFKGSLCVRHMKRKGERIHTSYQRQPKIPQIPYYHPCHLAKLGEEKEIMLCSLAAFTKNL